MARPARFELATLCLEGRRSIQLSYGRVAYRNSIIALEVSVHGIAAARFHCGQFCASWASLLDFVLVHFVVKQATIDLEAVGCLRFVSTRLAESVTNQALFQLRYRFMKRQIE